LLQGVLARFAAGAPYTFHSGKAARFELASQTNKHEGSIKMKNARIAPNEDLRRACEAQRAKSREIAKQQAAGIAKHSKAERERRFAAATKINPGLRGR
jgi:hypothetical protein